MDAYTIQQETGTAVQPNIIVISTHDTGCHFGCYGVPTVHTPGINRLASEGVRFDNMFATSSICSPSRGSLLTGRYPQSNGLVGLAGRNWGSELNDPRQHLSHIMRDNGYFTTFFGYQHETEHLSTLGFDDVSGAHPFQCANFFDLDKSFERMAMHDALNRYCRNAPDTARDAAAFIEGPAAKQKPFYMQLGFFETHTPYLWGGCEPDDSKGLHLPEYTRSALDATWNEHRLGPHVAAFQGSIRMVDAAVGIILDALDRSDLAENTLVLFTVDHGPELPRAKWTMLDAGLHVAFIMRWPGGDISGGRSITRMLSNVDFVPTLRDITAISVPKNVEGRSFASLLHGNCENAGPTRETAFALFSYVGLYCARTEHHKLIRQFTDEGESVELYDLRNDPLELQDRARDTDYASVLEDMNNRMREWLQRVGDRAFNRDRQDEQD